MVVLRRCLGGLVMLLCSSGPGVRTWRRLLVLPVVFSILCSSSALAWRRRRALAQPRYVCSRSELEGPPVAVHLTVSSLTKPRSRDIELNWSFGPQFEPWPNDTVTLSMGDPGQARSRQLSSVRVGDHQTGRFNTQRRFPRQELPLDNVNNRCTSFWTGYFRGTQLLAKNCLKILPSWMWQNRNSLTSMSVNELMLPGTHNSGTYKHSRDIVFKLVTTQDEDVWSQLMYGNRYLDLRIGYRPSNDRYPFWVYHDFFPVRPVNRIINHVKWFLNSTKEVVILDFHRFPVGFDEQRIHERFVEYLTSQLSTWMAPRVFGVTLGELWASNKRLIISYADRAARRQSPYLWPDIYQAWGNKQKVSDLYNYLRGQMSKRGGGAVWAAMAELTPSPWDILVPNKGLRDFAQKVNSYVTIWFREQWWSQASVVATDFFQGTDMVDVAIEANLKRLQCVADVGRQRGRRGAPRSPRFYTGLQLIGADPPR